MGLNNGDNTVESTGSLSFRFLKTILYSSIMSLTVSFIQKWLVKISRTKQCQQETEASHIFLSKNPKYYSNWIG